MNPELYEKYGHALSDRQIEILRLRLEGYSYRAIGEKFDRTGARIRQIAIDAHKALYYHAIVMDNMPLWHRLDKKTQQVLNLLADNKRYHGIAYLLETKPHVIRRVVKCASMDLSSHAQ